MATTCRLLLVALLISVFGSVAADGPLAAAEVRESSEGKWMGEESHASEEADDTQKPAESATPPPSKAARRHAIVLAYTGSTVDVDVERDGEDRIGFKGWALLGRIGLKERWGVQLGYRGMEDDEKLDSGEEISLDLLEVSGYWTWLETEHSRWHLRFGLDWMDFESTTPNIGRSSDQAIGPVIGTGFEWGGRRFALFVDFGLALANVELIPGEEEQFIVGNTVAGIMYKF